MMTNYSFFIDIDGTLICREKPNLSEEFRTVARSARALGAKIFINTARSRAIIPSELSDPEIFDGICTGGGTYIELGGKCVYSRYIDKDVLLEIVSSYERLGEKFTLIFEGAERMLYIGNKVISDEHYQHLPDGLKSLLPIINNTKVQKLYIPDILTNPPSKEFLDELSVRFEILYHTRYIEGMEYGFDKGGAIKIAERELNIPHESTVAIGDSVNDIAMLKYAETSVAMGDSPDNIKAMCTFVTDTPQNDGVAKAIKKLCFEV